MQHADTRSCRTRVVEVRSVFWGSASAWSLSHWFLFLLKEKVVFSRLENKGDLGLDGVIKYRMINVAQNMWRVTACVNDMPLMIACVSDETRAWEINSQPSVRGPPLFSRLLPQSHSLREKEADRTKRRTNKNHDTWKLFTYRVCVFTAVLSRSLHRLLFLLLSCKFLQTQWTAYSLYLSFGQSTHVNHTHTPFDSLFPLSQDPQLGQTSFSSRLV